jgi:hypothetical protein
MGMFDFLKGLRRAPASTTITKEETPLPGAAVFPNTEQGWRPTPENSLRYLYREFWVDPLVRQAIVDVRTMDATDGRVKKIHRQTSRAAVKGGLKLRAPGVAGRLHREWNLFERRLQLNRRDRLQSYVRALMMEGNLPLQWVLDADRQVCDCVRMPSETILPRVSPAGRFVDVRRAYDQIDVAFGTTRVLASFALWQLTLGRLDPDNYDDWGALGRPYLDASRAVWKKLMMAEEDLVIRRRMRAPLRMAHVLEGASAEEVEVYRKTVEADQSQGNFKDYYLNKKGAVTAVQGDAKLEEIADVVHLLDTFFAGAPAPKGLFGYVGDLSRDILQDLKQDFFDELDALQDQTSFVVDVGFRLHLLLRGLNPNAWDFEVQFAERRTDTPNQRADLALKYQALGVPGELLFEAAGLSSKEVLDAREREAQETDPYPDEGLDQPTMPGEKPIERGKPRVSVTPGNAPKGESQTTVSTRRTRA